MPNKFLKPGEVAKILYAAAKEGADALPYEQRARYWWLFAASMGADPGPYEECERIYKETHPKCA